MNNDLEHTSEEFEDAFSSYTGGCEITCACGRVYFDTYNTGVDWKEGELEGLIKKQKENPEKYFGRDCAIGTYIIDDKEVVLGCNCDFGKKYEDFILRHANQIARYLNKVIEKMKKEAEQREKVKL